MFDEISHKMSASMKFSMIVSKVYLTYNAYTIRSSWHEKLPGSYIPENWTTVKNEDLVFYTSSLSRQVCPATARTNTIRHVESACHVPDYNVDHRCRTGNDCGVDSTTCRQRTCSLAGYCGLWAFID
ncbi:hypothetical protein HPP92_016984 [Vanilla planifolia]|uniref:Uncharacterized protein n=1 Tax=Vanilla planifolia TaxID=51239 RepID=A0A835QJ42_VANPL|nr:hypothetical protein HPP92_016984 [Vanilla planifolia]